MDLFKMLFGMPLCSYIVEDEGGSDENKEPPIDEGKDDGDEYEAEVKKRGAKNIVEENRRRAQEMKELRDELEKLKLAPKPESKKEEVKNTKRELPPKLAKFIKKWSVEEAEGRRVDPEFLNDISESMLDTLLEALAWHTDNEGGLIAKKFSSLSKVQQRYQLDMLNDTIKEIGDKPKLKAIVNKYGDEIKTRIKKDVSPDYWQDLTVIESIIGKIHLEHLGENEDDKKDEPIKEKINESEPAIAKGSGSVSSEELTDYANAYNLDLSDPKVKKAAIEGVLAKRKAEKRME